MAALAFVFVSCFSSTHRSPSAFSPVWAAPFIVSCSQTECVGGCLLLFFFTILAVQRYAFAVKKDDHLLHKTVRFRIGGLPTLHMPWHTRSLLQVLAARHSKSAVLSFLLSLVSSLICFNKSRIVFHTLMIINVFFKNTFKTPRTSLVPIYRASVTVVKWECPQSPKDTKYLLPYHQTAEQLHSPGCEIPPFIIHTSFSKIDVAGLKDSNMVLFFKNLVIWKKKKMTIDLPCNLVNSHHSPTSTAVLWQHWHCSPVGLQAEKTIIGCCI